MGEQKKHNLLHNLLSEVIAIMVLGGLVIMAMLTLISLWAKWLWGVLGL